MYFWQTAFKKIDSAISGIGEHLKTAGNFIAGKTKDIGTKIQSGLRNVGDFVSSGIRRVTSGINNVTNKIGDIFKSKTVFFYH